MRVPSGDRTRPTTDRVREALFSALATWTGGTEGPAEQQLAGVRFLDLYAGSGAIGLEAASRGADQVVLVENHRSVVEVIRRNISATGLADRVQVRPMGVDACLAGPAEPFDIVWCDPPYGVATEVVDGVLARLADGWLAADGLVVVERSRRDPDPTWPEILPEVWTRRYGETQLHFGRPGTEEPQGER